MAPPDSAEVDRAARSVATKSSEKGQRASGHDAFDDQRQAVNGDEYVAQQSQFHNHSSIVFSSSGPGERCCLPAIFAPTKTVNFSSQVKITGRTSAFG
jgi:hypothetical protein